MQHAGPFSLDVATSSKRWPSKACSESGAPFGGAAEVGAKRTAGSLVDFASNDYLGLSHDPRVIEAAQRAAAECGTGSGASALGGRTVRLARTSRTRLARFEGQEAAVLFPTGYAANVGTITALVGDGRRDLLGQLESCQPDRRLPPQRRRGSIYNHHRLDESRSPLWPPREAPAAD